MEIYSSGGITRQNKYIVYFEYDKKDIDHVDDIIFAMLRNM